VAVTFSLVVTSVALILAMENKFVVEACIVVLCSVEVPTGFVSMALASEVDTSLEVV